MAAETLARCAGRDCIRGADDALHCRCHAADGKEGLPGQALLHLQGHPTSMACGYPPGPDRGEARLNSRFANVKSLKQSRRLRPRPGHPSACLTGPMGALVRWFLRSHRLVFITRQSSRHPVFISPLKPLSRGTGPVSASRHRRAAQGIKRSAVRSGATLARRKFRPRPGRHGWGGNSTRCGSPFLWVLSFGEAKAKYLAGGARPAKLSLSLIFKGRC